MWRLRPPALLVLASALRAVTPLPVGTLLQHPAHYFDLEHRRLRFEPRGPAAYDVTSAPFHGELSSATALGAPTDTKGYSWRTRLPFAFPFAGKSRDEVYINLNGGVTFDAPESTGYPERDTWPQGTMRWLASSLDVAALAGTRPMILPLWGLNSAAETHIFTRATRNAFTVTWQTVRYHVAHDAYPPLGESIFQVSLARDGSIEFRYGKVAEKDGVTGVFCGPSPAGRVLDHAELPPAPHVPPAVDLRLATLTDDGADLHFSLTLAAPVPSKADGHLRYAVTALSDGEGYVMVLNVGPAGRQSKPFCVVINAEDHGIPNDCPVKTIGIARDRTIDFYLPKIGLKNPARLEWRAQTFADANADTTAETGDLRVVPLAGVLPFGSDLRRAVRGRAGSLYEIFHYPFVPKGRMGAMQYIYQHAPADTEFAVALTDFRIDDIHNAGASNSSESGDPRELFHSPVLMNAAGPIYMGPQFAETVVDNGRPFRNYAYAVGWMAHEITHYWVATLKWKPPDTEALVDGLFHWNSLLNTQVVTPVWKLFSDTPYPEQSVMGGMAVEKLPGGHGHSVTAPFGVASGLCALDLYQMGLIGPEEVPDTFFISNPKPTGAGEYQGGEMVPVTIADIIAVNGPPAASGKHSYRLEIYLLHEDGRPPDPARLAQVRGMQAAVMQYFAVATNGRMTFIPAHE